MAAHSSIIAWRTPRTEDSGKLYSPWGRKESRIQLNDQAQQSLPSTRSVCFQIKSLPCLDTLSRIYCLGFISISPRELSKVGLGNSKRLGPAQTA